MQKQNLRDTSVRAGLMSESARCKIASASTERSRSELAIRQGEKSWLSRTNLQSGSLILRLMHLSVLKMTTKGGVVVAENTEVGIEALGVHCTETDDIHVLMLQSTKG